RRPHRRQRRHRQQDRDLLAGRAGRAPSRAVLRGRAVLDDRSHDRVGRGDPDRGARRIGSPPGRRTADRAERVAGVQPGLRRHAGPAHHGDRHRTRRHASAVSLLTAREYHDRTAHSPASVRTSGHTLEWDIKPFPFKVYTDLAALALPRELDPLATDTLAALADPPPTVSSLDLSPLAAVLYYAAGGPKQ